MMELKEEILFGVSEAFNHALEWKSRGFAMIQKDVCPSLRATDYKCPKYVWFEERESWGNVKTGNGQSAMGGRNYGDIAL